MGKLALLFIVSLSLLGLGAYVSQEPQSLESIRQRFVSHSPEKSDASWVVYTSSQNDYRFSHPPTWEYDDQVPGCGPVWFVSPAKEAWLTVCGPYEPDVIPQDESLPGVIHTQTVDGATTSQVLITTQSGVFALHFTDLADDINHQNDFEIVVTTFTQ
jgi:hypothetical protein